jgi:uncharacterized protein YidB (DUF937 family)
MAKGSPSMLALLGLLAVAGYQNRDRLGAMMAAAQRPGADRDPTGMGGGGLMDQLRVTVDTLTGGHASAGLADAGGDHSGRRFGTGEFGGGGLAGGGLVAALSEILDRFAGSQQQKTAQSWVGTGRNEPIGPDDLAQALDDETLMDLSEKTGLDRSELLARLSQTLPVAVDAATPDGTFPPVSIPEPRSA